MSDLEKSSKTNDTEVSNDTGQLNETRRNLFKFALGAGAVALGASQESMAIVINKNATKTAAVANDALEPSPVYPPSPGIATAYWWKESIPAYMWQPKATEYLDPSPQAIANTTAGECGRNDIQNFENFHTENGYDEYMLIAQEAMHKFTTAPNYPEQPIWGYDGVYPGPTFHARYGRPMVTRLVNDLPQDHIGYGTPEVSMHLHNMHTGSESDGFPGDYWSPNKYGPTLNDVGLYKDHCYHNVYAGYDNSRNPSHPDFIDENAIGDPREALGTLWYHDHTLDSTNANVIKGMAGFYLIFDDLDSGDENDPNDYALRLPSGEYDVPLMFQDMRFDASGHQFVDQMSPEGAVGDMVVVDGKIKPFLNVARRKYRLRLLNGGPTRDYEFNLVYNGVAKPFTRISSDGNLFEYPMMNQTAVNLSVAERADIIVDFSAFPLNAEVYLVNRLIQTTTRKPDGLSTIAAGNQVIKFKVNRNPTTPDNSRVLTAGTFMRELPPLPTQIAARRTFVFGRNNGVWTVNGKIFNVNTVIAAPKKGTAEIWTLRNDGGGWLHPIHIHFEEGRMLKRNGATPPLYERGRKDVFPLPPNGEVEVLFQFRDFNGKYIIHCHNLVHEDHAMMLRYDIVD